MVRNNRVVADTNELVVALSAARSEAVKRGLPMAVCARSGPTSDVCRTGTANDWSQRVARSSPIQRAPPASVTPATKSCSASTQLSSGVAMLTNDRPVVRFARHGTAAERRGGYDVHDQAQRLHRQQSAHGQDHRDRTPAHQQGSVPVSRFALRAVAPRSERHDPGRGARHAGDDFRRAARRRRAAADEPEEQPGVLRPLAGRDAGRRHARPDARQPGRLSAPATTNGRRCDRLRPAGTAGTVAAADITAWQATINRLLPGSDGDAAASHRSNGNIVTITIPLARARRAGSTARTYDPATPAHASRRDRRSDDAHGGFAAETPAPPAHAASASSS